MNQLKDILNPAEGQLAVYHNCNFGHEGFAYPVSSAEDAILILDAIASYDYYVHEQVYDRPDFCNTQGLLVFNMGEWEDWEDENYDDINKVRDAREEAAKAVDA